jgi:hypothetical protein
MKKGDKVYANCTFHWKTATIMKGRVGRVERLYATGNGAAVRFKVGLIPTPYDWIDRAPH